MDKKQILAKWKLLAGWWEEENLMVIIYLMVGKINYVSECCKYLKNRKVISEKTVPVFIISLQNYSK